MKSSRNEMMVWTVAFHLFTRCKTMLIRILVSLLCNSFITIFMRLTFKTSEEFHHLHNECH